MKLRYVGPYDAVDVPMPLGGWMTVAHGDVLSTDEAHGHLLLEQPRNWALDVQVNRNKAVPVLLPKDEEVDA